jgi:hypothetical protein
MTEEEIRAKVCAFIMTGDYGDLVELISLVDTEILFDHYYNILTKENE